MALSEVLIEKVRKAFVEQNFVGLVQYSEEEYRELLAYTSECSRPFAAGIGSYLRGDEEIVFATLVEIAKRWKSDDDSDEGFWEYICRTVMNTDYNPKLRNAYIEIITGLKYTRKIAMADTKKKYYATVMMHAFAPVNSVNAFFDFVYNIFKKDLDFDYTDADKYICDVAAEGFCAVVKNIGGTNVDVAIGSGAYGIKIGLRCMALGEETRENFVDLLDKALYLINSLYHGSNLADDDYMAHCVKEWWEKKSEKDSPSGAKRVSATTKQNITPKFIRQNCSVYLCIPPIRFAGGETPELYLSVYVGDNLKPTVSKTMFTRKGEITVTSVQQDVELNELLREASEINVRVEITENGKIIFNKAIEREFILFENEREVTNKIPKPGNYFVYALAIDDLQTPSDISTIAKNLYNLYASEGDILSGEQRQIFFSNSLDVMNAADKPQIVGESENCKWLYKDKACKVFGKRISLFVPHSVSVNGLELRIDGEGTLLSTLTPIADDECRIYDITDLIPRRVHCELVVYSYRKEKELLHDDIVFIPKLRVLYSKSFYYGADEKRVSVSVGEQQKVLSWSAGDDTVLCPLCDGKLEITIPQFKWRIDMGDWRYGPIEGVAWYKDFLNSGSALEVYAPTNIRKLKLFCRCDCIVQEISLDTSLRFKIGQYVFSNEGRRKLTFFLKLMDGDRLEICDVTTEEHFTQLPPLAVENNKLLFVGDRSFVGDKKPYFNIRLNGIGIDEIKNKSTDLTDGILTGVEEGIYWVTVSAPSSGLFGGNEKTLWEGEFVYGDREKIALSKLVLKINPICGFGTEHWKRNSSGYYLSELTRAELPNTYFAKLHCSGLFSDECDVSGYSECKIEIISPIALQLCVKDAAGNYLQKLKCDTKGNLYHPESQQKFWATNYHFIEVKNV